MLIAIGLALIGLLLVYFEFFVPGGILGILGGVLMIGSLIIFVWEQDHITWLIVYIFALIALLAFTIRLALWKIKRTKGKNTMYAWQDQEGFLASTFNRELIGKSGIALTNLKPAGHVRVEGERAQAVSQGSYVKKGEAIKVVSGEGARLIVRKE